jgi:3-oxoacyl-[acyl-carrier protein] reductase
MQEAGMTVIGVSRRAPASAALLENFRALDLLDDTKTLHMVKDVKDRHGSIALVVHAAALNKNNLLLRCNPTTDIIDVLNTNLTAPLQLTRHVLRYGGLMKLKEHGGGSVIFVGSTVGIYGNPGQIGYAASKGALGAVCKSLAKEYSAASHVRFNVVAPGLINGPGMAEALGPEAQKAWADASCMKRLVDVDDVVDGVLALAACKMINGHTLVVDGGHN